MEYFLELTQHEGEFIVPHKMLIKYGVVSSKRSSVILEKLDQLNLEINKDFNLQDILQVRQNRGEVLTKVYYLTPNAFKKCLMRARKYKNQEVNPVVYVDYYFLLEKVFKLYTDYERQYAKCLLTIKDDKIDSMSLELKQQSKQLDQQSKKIDAQSIEIQEMLANSRHIINQNNNLSTQVTDLHAEVTEVNNKLTALFDFMLSFDT